MLQFADIKAQATAVETLQKALAGDRLAQGYLFTGPSGVGKQAAALALACARNCQQQPEGACGRCNVCQRIGSGQHPDVRVFAPRDEGNRNLQVETIREDVLPFTKFAPFEARTAFVIFPDADISLPAHHAEGANAILKTLEEPRDNLVFLLLSSRPERLLPTIRSRCQRVRFGPLPPSLIEEIVGRTELPDAARATATALAAGSADRALELSESGQAEAILQWALRLDTATSEGGIADCLDLAEELARHPDRGLILETLGLFYRDVAAAGLGQTDGLGFRDHEAALSARAADLGPGEAAERVMRLQALSEAMARNANPQLALDALLLSLR